MQNLSNVNQSLQKKKQEKRKEKFDYSSKRRKNRIEKGYRSSSCDFETFTVVEVKAYGGVK